MSSASWALQAAMYAALAADETLVAQVGARIFDAPPRSCEFPYVVFAEETENEWNTVGDAGSEHTLVLHVWSRNGGRKECKAIADTVRACLEDAALTLAGHRLVGLWFSSANFRRESDGKTFRARIEFRALTEPEP